MTTSYDHASPYSQTLTYNGALGPAVTFTFTAPVFNASYQPPAPSLSIDVYTPAGIRVGSGPIRSAVTWKNIPRLDRAGDFSFVLPAADPRNAYLAYHNVVVANWFLNGVWTEIGRGIVDDIRVVGGSNPTLLTVSGSDMLRQLAWRSVGTITLAKPTSTTVVNPNVSSLTPTDIHKLHINVGGDGSALPGGYETRFAWYDGLIATHQTDQPGSWHFMYICYDDPYASVNVLLLNRGTTNPLTWRIQYYNGTDWINLTGIVDGTFAPGVSSWQNDGTISWVLPSDWQPLEQLIVPPGGDPTNAATYVNLTGYWTRWIPVGPPADGQTGVNRTDIREITINGLIPTEQAVANILGVANGTDGAVSNATGYLFGPDLPGPPPSLGWRLDVTEGQPGTTKLNVFAAIQDDTVLAALIKLSELSNEHFRVGPDKQLVWLGTNTPSSGIRAIRPVTSSTFESNPNACAIISLDRQTNTAQLVTRIIPFGAGNNQTRVTLAQTTRPVTTTFTDPGGVTHTIAMTKSTNSLLDLTMYNTYGLIDSVQIFNYIAPALANSPPSALMASNALFDAALIYLMQHSQPIVTFSLVVTGVDKVVYPGQTIRIVWKELTDVSTVLDIDQTLIVLEATNEVTAQGYLTTAMVVSQYPRWPLSDVELLAQLEQRLKAMGSYPQSIALTTVSTPVAPTSGLTLFDSGRGYVSQRSTRAR